MRVAKQYSQEKCCNHHKTLMAVSMILAMSAKGTKAQQQIITFDTDSKPVGIDNQCSAFISHDTNDFIEILMQSDKTIKGFGGVKHYSNIMVGAIKWKWCNDQGRVHKHLISNSYFVPHGKARLLSPQHWAKQQKGQYQSATGEFTNFNQCILQWGPNEEYKLSVPLSKDTNVATFMLASGYKNYDLFCQEAEIDNSKEDDSPITVTEVTDDEEVEQPVPTGTFQFMLKYGHHQALLHLVHLTWMDLKIRV